MRWLAKLMFCILIIDKGHWNQNDRMALSITKLQDIETPLHRRKHVTFNSILIYWYK